MPKELLGLRWAWKSISTVFQKTWLCKWRWMHMIILSKNGHVLWMRLFFFLLLRIPPPPPGNLPQMDSWQSFLVTKIFWFWFWVLVYGLTNDGDEWRMDHVIWYVYHHVVTDIHTLSPLNEFIRLYVSSLLRLWNSAELVTMNLEFKYQHLYNLTVAHY